MKNRRIPSVVSSCNRVKSFPTAALSTSGIRVEGDSFLSACQYKLPCIFNCKIKTGDHLFGDVSCKKSLRMTSYGGITRIRLKGRSLSTSSQPANTSSPVLYVSHYNANYYDCQFFVISFIKYLLLNAFITLLFPKNNLSSFCIHRIYNCQ